MGMSPPKNYKEADEWLKIENIENFERPFSEYINFCEDLGVVPYVIGENEKYIMGKREVEGLNFISLNSAWFCRGNKDKGDLWIGLPQLKLMNAEKQLVNKKKYDEDKITIALHHHPPSWLNDSEDNSYGNRTNTYRYLSNRTHLILCGHVHGVVIEKPDRKYESARLFSVGATYSGNDYKNHCSILQIDKKERIVRRKSLLFDPNFEEWKIKLDESEYSLSSPPTSYTEKKELSDYYDYTTLVKKSREYVESYVKQKLSAISQTKNLPSIIDRKVAVHNIEERVNRTQDNKIDLNTNDKNIAFIDELVTVGNPTFLFGELGSGKSTLVSNYILELAEEMEGLIPLLIPARFFLDKNINSISDINSIISKFINDEVTPYKKGFNIEKTLLNKKEVVLVIDGFDELNKSLAQKLLFKTGRLAKDFARLRVIATGRPIELKGLDYSEWQCLEMISLSSNEREEILFHEAIADGLETYEAKKDSKTRLKILVENNELNGIATTPLILRLLRPHLTKNARNKTLGDLLYDIIQQRLGEWDAIQNREENIKDFKNEFPTPLSREKLLGEVAYKVYKSDSKSITKESLYKIIECEVNELSSKNKMISQGCQFFKNNFLQKNGDEFSFTLEPLFEFALGIYIYNRFNLNESIRLKSDNGYLWREFSFALTIARRKSAIGEMRDKLIIYFNEIFNWPNKASIPVTSILVYESRDKVLAEKVLIFLNKCDFRPIVFYQDFKSLSAIAIAYLIYLNEKKGFYWFYENYLNPIYPIDMSESRIFTPVLQNWIVFCDYKLTREQKNILSNIPKFHIESNSWGCNNLLPSLVMVLPDVFKIDMRLKLYAKNLSSNLFKQKARKYITKEFENFEQKVLLSLEIEAEKEKYDNSISELWLELSDNKPTISILNNLVRTINIDIDRVLLNEVKNRIGENNLKSYLKWCVLKNNKLASYAAILLYEMGEENLHLLGQGLLEGLHDGGKVKSAEEILNNIIKANEEKGLKWLVERFSKADGLNGAHSGYWRILLRELNNTDKKNENLLDTVIPYLGKFILPRYPEIRREFQILLSNDFNYKKILEKNLNSLNEIRRFNSACILVCSFPEEQKRAIEIVIKSVSRLSDYREWNKFCMKLSFGQPVLEHIKKILNSLLPLQKTFALCLLYHNDCNLNNDEFEELIEGLLGKGYLFDSNATIKDDNIDPILSDETAYEMLLFNLENENIDKAESAAQALLRYHEDKLSVKEYAQCFGMYFDRMSNVVLNNASEKMDEVIKDKEYKDEIMKTCIDKNNKEFKESFLFLYLKSFENKDIWKDILWKATFGKSFLGPNDMYSYFMWIYNKAKEDSIIREVLGKASIDFLDKSNIKENQRYNDEIFWIALFADEFGDLKQESLRKMLINYKSINEEIVASLLARLNYIPDEFEPKKQRYLIKKELVRKDNSENILEKDILEVIRDSNEIDQQFIKYIGIVLKNDIINEDKVTEIALKSKFGLLFATIIDFCRKDSFENYDWLANILTIELSRNYQNNEAASSLVISIKIIREVILKDSDKVNDYLKAIENKIRGEDNFRRTDLYKELLKVPHIFNINMLPGLFSEISDGFMNFDFELAYYLINFLLQDFSEDELKKVKSELKKVVRCINGQINKPYNRKYRGLSELVFSLSFFYFYDEKDLESEQLFLLGLKSIFIHDNSVKIKRKSPIDKYEKQFFAKDIMNIIYPLLDKVSPQIIHSCIKRGVESDNIEIAMCCKILFSLIKKR